MRRGEVIEFLGISRDAMTELVRHGVLEEVHLIRDKKGRPRDKAYFRRAQVTEVAGEGGKR